MVDAAGRRWTRREGGLTPDRRLLRQLVLSWLRFLHLMRLDFVSHEVRVLGVAFVAVWDVARVRPLFSGSDSLLRLLLLLLLL